MNSACKKYHFCLQQLEERDRKVNLHKDNLNREQRYLRRRLELLSNQVDTIYKRRSVSECSTSTVSSTHSSHSESGKLVIFLIRAFIKKYDDILISILTNLSLILMQTMKTFRMMLKQETALSATNSRLQNYLQWVKQTCANQLLATMIARELRWKLFKLTKNDF